MSAHSEETVGGVVTVRVMRHDEFSAVRALSIAAFGDNEEIGTLLDELRSSWAWDASLSFVADLDGGIVGHVLYTHAILDSPSRLVEVLVLSPIGVQPALQRRGIGSRLVIESLGTLAGRAEPLIFLEGHPSYYPRFGFEKASALGFTAPSRRIPDDAFMVYRLPTHQPWMSGTLVYPDAFWRADAVGLR